MKLVWALANFNDSKLVTSLYGASPPPPTPVIKSEVVCVCVCVGLIIADIFSDVVLLDQVGSLKCF